MKKFAVSVLFVTCLSLSFQSLFTVKSHVSIVVQGQSTDESMHQTEGLIGEAHPSSNLDENAEDEAMAEIIELQRKEEEALVNEERETSADAERAAQAEKEAKEKEARERDLEREKQRKERLRAKDEGKEDNLDWVKRSRPGAAAKPGANLKQSKSSEDGREGSTAIESEKRNYNRDNRLPETDSPSSKAGASGYFSGTKKDDSLEQEAKREAARRAAEQKKGKISSGAGDRRRDIESKLSPELRAKHAAAVASKVRVEKEKTERLLRYKIPRKFGRPVERSLDACQAANVNIYSVLGVSNGADLSQIKKAYRQAALNIHPDKNPHPDAKLAFDCIQEAFEILSNPVKRRDYDAVVDRKRSRWTANLLRNIRDTFLNSKSRALLLLARIQKGEFEEEISELKAFLLEKREQISLVLERFSHANSLLDRGHLALELIYDHKSKAAIALAILLLPVIIKAF